MEKNYEKSKEKTETINGKEVAWFEHLSKHVGDMKNLCTELNDQVNILRSFCKLLPRNLGLNLLE